MPKTLSSASQREAFELADKIVDSGNPPAEPVPQLVFFATAEGYYDYENNRYIYQYKDHLGNVRVSYLKDVSTGDLKILDRNDYYPFGMNFLTPFGKSSVYDPMAIPYNYKYNGKELQETGMYDYGARFYMPDIGRWMSPDPMSEEFSDWSPYHYVYNNPLMYNDPTGMFGECPNGNCPEGVKDIIKLPNGEKETQIQEVVVVGKKKQNAALNAVQTTLDVIGIWDPFGIADGINAGIYLYNGDYKNAGISALGIIPFVGDLGKGYKYGAKALSKVDEIVDATKGVQGVYEITTKSGKKYVGKSKDVAKRLKQHKNGSKSIFKGEEIVDVKVTEVLGAPIDVAVHEQNTLMKITDGVHPSKVDNVLNKVNAVGPARAGEMGRTVTTGRTFGH